MRIGPYKRLGPDLETTWGTYPSPFISQPARTRKPWLPPTVRGRHAYRTQPRDLSVLAPDPAIKDRPAVDQMLRHMSTRNLNAPHYAHGVGADDPQQETKVGFYIFLGVLGLAALALGGK